MKVGDLVMFQECEQQFMYGIISQAIDPDPVFWSGTALYWVVFSGGELCFTGNQLRVVP